MRPFRLLGILLLSFSSSGCHVVDKARECSALSTVLENAQKTINLTEKGAPSPQDLEAKASQYSELAHSVKAVKFSEKNLAAQQKALVEQFHLIETQLRKAAEILKEAETPGEAITENELHARDDTAEEPASETKEKSQIVPQNRQQQASSDLPGKKLNRDNSVSERIRHRGPSAKMSASRYRTDSLKRRYAQASKAVETGNHQVDALVKRIAELCRK